MVYIKIHAEDVDKINQWVRDNIDPSAKDSFIVNKKDSNANKFCLISLPNNNSLYNQKLLEKLGEVTFAPETPGKREYKIDVIKDGTFLTKSGKVRSTRNDKLVDLGDGV